LVDNNKYVFDFHFTVYSWAVGNNMRFTLPDLTILKVGVFVINML